MTKSGNLNDNSVWEKAGLYTTVEHVRQYMGWNAAAKVLGPSLKHILCHWHVYRLEKLFAKSNDYYCYIFVMFIMEILILEPSKLHTRSSGYNSLYVD